MDLKKWLECLVEDQPRNFKRDIRSIMMILMRVTPLRIEMKWKG